MPCCRHYIHEVRIVLHAADVRQGYAAYRCEGGDLTGDRIYVSTVMVKTAAKFYLIDTGSRGHLVCYRYSITRSIPDDGGV